MILYNLPFVLVFSKIIIFLDFADNSTFLQNAQL
jgi:hypothetical protein